jgi:uncharacterized LabA/DUF88 family protein
MIDGWFMRKVVQSKRAFPYNGPKIREYCQKHQKTGDYLYRIFYYDTEPLNKKGQFPISGHAIDFSNTAVAKAQNRLFASIRSTPNFALRLGKTTWQNNEWIIKPDILKNLLSGKIAVSDLTDSDFCPLIKQKAVDMKLGLDITHIAVRRLSDLLVIITGDADIVPALKCARREGMQVCLDPLRRPIRPELSEHVDFISSYI